MNPVLLIELLVVLALVGGLFYSKSRKKAAAIKKTAEKIKSRNVQQSAPPPARPAPSPSANRGEEAIKVSEVDPLEEVNIYIEYGYYERAAETLLWYVEHGGGAKNSNALKMLLQVYFHLGQIDKYAVILEKLAASGEPADFIKMAVLAGLREDPENLDLRVLAESHLSLGIAEVNALIGAPEKKVEEKVEEKPVEIPEPRVSGARIERRKKPRRRKLPLVKGEAPIAPLSSDEIAILEALVPPVQAAKLYLALEQDDEAVSALRKAISDQPKALVHFTEMLRILHFRSDLEEYAKTLWHFYTVVENYGQDLKDRLLGVGFGIGYHPVLEALAAAKEMRHVEAIGKAYGFYPPESPIRKKISLVEVVAANASSHDDSESDSVLREADSYLEYGQIEEALEVLERAIVEDPHRVQLYQPLLDLYDRMDALDRFNDLAMEIKKHQHRPPDEVTAMMASLGNRLQLRMQRATA